MTKGLGSDYCKGQLILFLHCFQARRASYLMGKGVLFILVANYRHLGETCYNNTFGLAPRL